MRYTRYGLQLFMENIDTLICGCSLSWMKKTSVAWRITIDSRPCAEPESSRTVEWNDLTVDEMEEYCPIESEFT